MQTKVPSQQENTHLATELETNFFLRMAVVVNGGASKDARGILRGSGEAVTLGRLLCEGRGRQGPLRAPRAPHTGHRRINELNPSETSLY